MKQITLHPVRIESKYQNYQCKMIYYLCELTSKSLLHFKPLKVSAFGKNFHQIPDLYQTVQNKTTHNSLSNYCPEHHALRKEKERTNSMSLVCQRPIGKRRNERTKFLHNSKRIRNRPRILNKK